MNKNSRFAKYFRFCANYAKTKKLIALHAQNNMRKVQKKYFCKNYANIAQKNGHFEETLIGFFIVLKFWFNWSFNYIWVLIVLKFWLYWSFDSIGVFVLKFWLHYRVLTTLEFCIHWSFNCNWILIPLKFWLHSIWDYIGGLINIELIEWFWFKLW